MPHGDGIGEGGSPRFEAAWERYLMAEQSAEDWLALEDVAPDGTQGGGRRYRCVAEGCGREVLVVRDSRDASLGDPRPATA